MRRWNLRIPRCVPLARSQSTRQPRQENGSGKTMLADCVKSCAAMPMLGQAALVWSPDVWPKSESAGMELSLSGYSPKPEIPPPISLV